MRTQLPATSRLITATAFALVCVVLFILAYEGFGGTIPFTPESYRVSLHMPDAGNLVPGSDVQIAGVKVGRVERVARAGGQADVLLQIAPQYSPIRSGATAIMRTKTLLGEAYVELAPGPQSAKPVPDGGQLSPSHVLSTVTLDQFMKTFNPTALNDIRQYFNGFAAALKGRSQSLNESLGRTAPFTGNLAGIMQTLDAETPQLQQVFASTGVVMQALGDRAGDLQAAIKEGNALFGVTAQRNQDLSALMQSLAPFLSQVQATSQTITLESSDFDRAMIDMLPVGTALPPALREIRADLPALRQLFRDLPSTMTAGERGFPAISKILRALPSGLGPLYPALRQFVPLMKLFATYALTGFVHPLADAAASENGTVVGPAGKIISRPNATLYTSNETLAGCVKRLPTHRSNDYPRPDAFDAIAQQGFLRSFDCRDVNNPDYLPPQAVGGTGVPPCMTQGPWWYNGKRAYYPRLQQASP